MYLLRLLRTVRSAVGGVQPDTPEAWLAPTVRSIGPSLDSESNDGIEFDIDHPRRPVGQGFIKNARFRWHLSHCSGCRDSSDSRGRRRMRAAGVKLSSHDEDPAPVTILDGLGRVIRIVPAQQFRRDHGVPGPPTTGFPASPERTRQSERDRAGRSRARRSILIERHAGQDLASWFELQPRSARSVSHRTWSAPRQHPPVAWAENGVGGRRAKRSAAKPTARLGWAGY
jgi:hypothetical protein